MQENQTVTEMASEVLTHQARTYAQRTGESFEHALKAVLETEAGRQLKELGDGPHRDETADRWQEDLTQERYEQRSRARHEDGGESGL